MLEAKALELMLDTKGKSVTAQVVDAKDPRKLLINVGGVLTERPVPPDPRSHTVNSLDDLSDYVLQAVKKPVGDGPVVWHGKDKIIVILDDADRYDRVCLPLAFSKPYLTLAALDAQPTFLQHPEFVRMLRLKLGLAADQILPFRNVNFARQEGAQGNVVHGGNTLGKSINAQLVNADTVPQEMTITAKVYDTAGVNKGYAIRVAVEIDMDRSGFTLVPFPGEVQYLLDQCQAVIAGTLKERFSSANVPVYYGSP